MIEFACVGEFALVQLPNQPAVRVWVFRLDNDEDVHAIGCDKRGDFLHFHSKRFVDVLQWVVGLAKD